jgi:hypothetical protein
MTTNMPTIGRVEGYVTSDERDSMKTVKDLEHVVELLRITLGGSLGVVGCVASQTPEDFTTPLEMHLLIHGSYPMTEIDLAYSLEQN